MDDDIETAAGLALCAIAYFNFVNVVTNKVKKKRKARRWWVTQIHRNRTGLVIFIFAIVK